jgi:hypothetical protein
MGIWLLIGFLGLIGTEGIPDRISREIGSLELLPKGRYVFVRSWEAEGGECAHHIGKAVRDEDAEGGLAWEANTYSDPPANHMAFGPYLELKPGNYVAFFRIKLMEDAGEEVVADIDACVDYGRRILASREVSGSDLLLSRYVQIPLPFQYPGGKLECRVYWRGYSSLRLDAISLLSLEAGRLEIPSQRVPQPVPSGFPKDLPYFSEPRPFPDIFPRSSRPSPTLLVVDIRRYPPDWQLMAITLQGIVNRSRPLIYCLLNPTDEFWLEWMRKRGWIEGTESVGSPEGLLLRFLDRIRGFVIYDPYLPATKNVATMIAAVEDGVVVSPRIAEEMERKGVRLPILFSLKGKWKKSADAYRWAFENLWDKLNHHVIACSWPDHLGLRDYLVQNKIFTFWIPGPIDGAKSYSSPEEEVRLAEEFLSKMPVNIPVMSYPWAGKDIGIGEGPGVTLFSEFGKYLVGSINCTNLSVHSGIGIENLKQKERPSPPALQDDKVYISFIISDGDNLPVLTNSNFPQLWQEEVRGRIPLGWTISPSAIMLIPDIVDYYYSTATPKDCFLGAVSGIGYAYPDHYGKRFVEGDRMRVFDEFLDQTRRYMEAMDLREIWIMGVTDPSLISRYAERIPFLSAIFPDYGKRVSSYDEATYPVKGSVPVFHAVTGWAEGISREQQISSLVSQIRAITPEERPAFLHFFVLNWFADLRMLEEIAGLLGPEYVVVRPDHLAELFREHMAREKVLIRSPRVLVGLENIPLAFDISLHNPSSKPIEAAISISEGLKGPSILPSTVGIEPGRSIRVEISGMPSGKVVKVLVEGPFGRKEVGIKVDLIPEEELVLPLPFRGPLRFVGRFEAEALPHRSGKEEGDPDASGGKAWVARVGRAEPGFIVFGPYAPLKEGDYVALFRLKAISEGSGVIATLDTCVGGGSPVTSSHELKVEDLAPGRYRVFPLPFKHPGGGVETRVIWNGRFSLAVDSITLLSTSTTSR